ncbi:MAG: DoxX family protein [Planctomycetota bacterium]|nr:DoxX family protein [Planctomycetota bacterium]
MSRVGADSGSFGAPARVRSLVESALLIFPARVAIGGLFLFSAWQKLKPAAPPRVSGPQSFALNLQAFDIVPTVLVKPTAFILPWAEVIAGILVVVGLWTRAAGALIGVMLASFTLGVVSVILRGMDITCGCFGGFKLLCEGPIGWCKVGENALLIAIAMVPALRGGGRFSIDALLQRGQPFRG